MIYVFRNTYAVVNSNWGDKFAKCSFYKNNLKKCLL